MSTTTCPACKTFNGWIERHRFGGRKLKPVRCLNHAEPFATCDVCACVSPITTTTRTGYDGKRSFLVHRHNEAFGGPWQTLPVGVALRTFGDRNEYVEDKTTHVCAECADTIRRAMQVAFDQCVAARASICAGVTLDATTPNRVIVAEALKPTETMTKTVTQ